MGRFLKSDLGEILGLLKNTPFVILTLAIILTGCGISLDDKDLVLKEEGTKCERVEHRGDYIIVTDCDEE